MAFIQVRPQRQLAHDGYTGNKVRVTFPIIGKRPNLVLYLGKDVCRSLGWKENDKLEMYVDDAQPLMWFFRKGPIGWKITSITGNSQSFKFQKVVPAELQSINLEENQGFVTAQIHEGGLVIFLPKCPIEDKNELHSTNIVV